VTDDVLMQKLASIDRCLRSIRTFVAGDLNRLNDQIVHDAAVLNVQRACEQAIDAACRVVSQRKLGIPSDSADAFQILGRERLLSEKTVASMCAMIGVSQHRGASVSAVGSSDPSRCGRTALG